MQVFNWNKHKWLCLHQRGGILKELLEWCHCCKPLAVFSCQCYPLSICVTLPRSLSHPIRNPGEDTKMLVCDMCDKGYHTFCLQPAMDSLPTNGWRCKVGKDESLCPGKCFRAATHERESNASRDQSVFSNNLPWLILADSDQQYSHAILLWVYLHTHCHNTWQYHCLSFIHPPFKCRLSLR